MVRLFLVVCSLMVLLGTGPASAQNAGDVLQGIGRAMNGNPPPPRDPSYSRQDERERAYREQRRLDAEQRDLDARRRAMHGDRRYNEDNGFYGR